MPSEDTFFDEPLVEDYVQYGAPPKVLAPHQEYTFSNEKLQAQQENNTLLQLLESSKRKELLLEKIVSEMERMNRRLLTLENLSPSHPVPAAKTFSPTGSPVSSSAAPRASRGTLVLPPGSKPSTVPNLPDKKPVLSNEDVASREQDEHAAILRRRNDEEARLARLEAERKQREQEEERKRLAELKRVEEERRMKEELDKKTRGLMTGLLASNSGGGLFEDDIDSIAAPGLKKSGGLFDD